MSTLRPVTSYLFAGETPPLESVAALLAARPGDETWPGPRHRAARRCVAQRASGHVRVRDRCTLGLLAYAEATFRSELVSYQEAAEAERRAKIKAAIAKLGADAARQAGGILDAGEAPMLAAERKGAAAFGAYAAELEAEGVLLEAEQIVRQALAVIETGAEDSGWDQDMGPPGPCPFDVSRHPHVTHGPPCRGAGVIRRVLGSKRCYLGKGVRALVPT